MDIVIIKMHIIMLHSFAHFLYMFFNFLHIILAQIRQDLFLLLVELLREGRLC